MWIAAAIVFVIGWLLLKLVWGVAAFGVHFLLAAAVVALIIHFVAGRSAGGPPSLRG